MSPQNAQKHTPVWTILVVVVCTLLISTAQVLLKTAAAKPFPGMLFSVSFIVGFALSCSAGLLLLIALKHGELSVLYPIIALGFVWVTLTSIFLLHERPSAFQIAGIACVILGISIIGHQGSRRRA